ncbi:MAG: VOC family protein [Chloroflexi bacterium]|nr:VOC family protein [Chloroflexota bacterium]
MPSITGIAHVELTVRDLAESEAWYVNLLGFRHVFDGRDSVRGLVAVALFHPETKIVFALIQHPDAGVSSFDARRPGLDHLAFAVRDRAELRAWEARLAELGLDYSPFEQRSAETGRGAAVTAFDPDGIAIEFFVGGE